MNNLQKRKLRQRLVITMISILSCIAVMSVGVYAATKNFEVSVVNQVSIQVLTLNGELTGRRGGDVIYGMVSRGDADSSLNYTDQNASIGYINLYGIQEGKGFSEYTDNLNEITENVNFYTSAKDENGNKKNELTIFYVFKFVLDKDTETDVTVSVTNESTKVTDNTNGDLNSKRSDKVSMSYKYYFGENEPDWTVSGTSFEIDNGGTKSVKIEKTKVETHTIYVYASMTVKRTNTLKDAYTIGMGGEAFNWKFGLSFAPAYAKN